MRAKSKFYITFQIFCLVSTLHFVALSVGGIHYLSFFLPKEKIVSVQNKTETEKKTSSNATDDVPESEDIDAYKVVCILHNYSVFDKDITLSESFYHSALTLFSSYSSRILRGHFDVIIQPPRV
ncbi:hypothetical protein [Arcicella rosea]|uniref:Uncharacterized protein n=1 Tax=Arcicella rosea TaxID=502909 RepID=A0A841ES71_9BACT|nr:hypothetical protein [Arcicella rosea]MBB6003100.1 hypothetical protein [Arcicella rosea]